MGVESERGLFRRKREPGGFAILAPGPRASRLSWVQGAKCGAPVGPPATRAAALRASPA